MTRVKDLTNMKFGMLTVVEKTGKPNINSEKRVWWKCKCDCGNECIKATKTLTRGEAKSCGCLRKTTNKVVFKDGVALIYLKNCKNPAIIDAEDYDKVKDFYWTAMRGNYIRSQSYKHSRVGHLLLHRLIMNADNNVQIDHIDGNPLNNSKSNLRFATSQQNSFNRSKSTKNTSGQTGVSWIERDKCWRAYITVSKKLHHIGCFKTKEDAIKAREDAEIKYFGEYRKKETK